MKGRSKLLSNFLIVIFTFLLLSAQTLFAYTFTWDQATGTLTINATHANGEYIIVCVCSGGDVTVNGDWLKDTNNNYVHIAGNAVTNLIINGSDAYDVIDVSCVGQSTFPNLESTGDEFRVQINAGGGDDEVYGSSFNTEVNAGDGHDYVETYEGNDKINGGEGNDVVWSGEGNDEINGEGGHDELDGQEIFDRSTDKSLVKGYSSNFRTIVDNI